jgi:hypothetical protein
VRKTDDDPRQHGNDCDQDQDEPGRRIGTVRANVAANESGDDQQRKTYERGDHKSDTASGFVILVHDIQPPSSGVVQIVSTPQAHKTIRVLVFYGGDASVFDVPRRN